MKTDYQSVSQSIETPFKPDQIQVSEDGKNVMRPDVMQFLMQASVASQVTKIRKYFDDRTPNGTIQTWTIPVTQARQRVRVTWEAQAVSFINDGPNRVFIWINTLGRPPHTVNLNETFNINFETHKLREFYHQCDPGNAATIRVVAQD